MMGFNSMAYQEWIEAAGHQKVEDLFTFALAIDQGLPELTNRIVAMGEKSGKIQIRRVNKSKFDEEAALILSILNDAWSELGLRSVHSGRSRLCGEEAEAHRL